MIKPIDAVKLALETYTPDVNNFLENKEYRVAPWTHRFGCNGDNCKIDGAGEWVRICKKHGLYLYPGANTIFREYTKDIQEIQSDTQLEIGMVVFKIIKDGHEPKKYHGDEIGNVWRIGIIVAVKPAIVLFAEPYEVKIRKGVKNNNWTHCGYIKFIETAPEEFTMFVTKTNKNAPFKKMPYINAKYVNKEKLIQSNETVVVLAIETSEWYKVEYKGEIGFIEKKYVYT